MLSTLLLAASLVVGTVFVHTGCTLALLATFASPSGVPRRGRLGLYRGALAIAGVVLALALAAVLESAVWAAAYLLVGALPDFGDALYFSLVTFTTLGYGDITLAPRWQLLAAFQATNGIILFGWTTAVIVAVVQRIIRAIGAPEA